MGRKPQKGKANSDDPTMVQISEEAVEKAVSKAMFNAVGVAPVLTSYATNYADTVKTANRIWSMMAILAVFILVPAISDTTADTHRQLPFGLGQVSKDIFIPLALILFNALAMFYSQCRAHAFRIYNAGHALISDSSTVDPFGREHYSLILYPSINRMKPLVNLLKRDSDETKQTPSAQAEEPEKPTFGENVRSAYYLVLRFVSASVILGVPLIVMALCFCNVVGPFEINRLSTWQYGLAPIALISTCVVFIGMAQLMVQDFLQAFVALRNT